MLAKVRHLYLTRAAFRTYMNFPGSSIPGQILNRVSFKLIRL